MIIEYSADIKNTERSFSGNDYYNASNNYYVKIKAAEDVGRFGYVQPELTIGVGDNRKSSIMFAISQLKFLIGKLEIDLDAEYD